jgi:lysosomal acid lipase/cholesteryl ester hydrolase
MIKELLVAIFIIGVAAAYPHRVHNVQVRNYEFENQEQQEEVMALRRSDPEESMLVPDIILYYGYPAEVHHVTTQDGYILEMHRISHGFKSDTAFKGPIFLQHGLFSSSADWVLNVGDENLAFNLADAGYDVWMGNARGNKYSRAHVVYNPDNSHEFWKFSWDEMAKYDVPAMIDYVLVYTEQKQIPYIGFSMGTSIMFALLSESPEFNEKISAFFALAPVAYGGHMTGPVKLFAPLVNFAQALTSLLGVDELLPSSKLMKFLGDTLCEVAPRLACENFLFVATGYDPYQMNATRLPVYIAHTPAGTSVQNLVHYAQVINTGRFQKYSYGLLGNLANYGTIIPPEYDVSKITTPVALFWGQNDIFADPRDVAILAKKLRSLKSNYKVPFDLFTHLDFQWAVQAKSLVYDKLLEVIPQVTRK